MMEGKIIRDEKGRFIPGHKVFVGRGHHGRFISWKKISKDIDFIIKDKEMIKE